MALIHKKTDMDEEARVSIELVDPRMPEITDMIRALDRYMTDLYPAESNHLVDVETLSGADVRFFAARMDGKYCGCGAIMVRPGDHAEVKRIYVSPNARGSGLGKRILERLEAEARALGLPLMRLETGRLQPEALNLFAAFGFTRCGAFGDYPSDDPYSVFMEKSVRPS